MSALQMSSSSPLLLDPEDELELELESASVVLSEVLVESAAVLEGDVELAVETVDVVAEAVVDVAPRVDASV